MTTIRLKFRPSSIAGKEGTLYYQVVHLRRVALIHTDYRIYPQEWNEGQSVIQVPDKIEDNGRRRATLLFYQSKINWEMNRMREAAIKRERTSEDYTIDELIDDIRQIPPCVSVFTYIASLIERKTRMRCFGTARTYINALRSFQTFRRGVDLTFGELSCGMMQEYEAWMLHRGLKRTSSACYMRTIRTFYHCAIEEGQTEGRELFRRVHVSIGKTRKRAVSADIIQAILHLDLTGRKPLEFARDIFMFSFYTRGMSFVDIAYLRKSDLRHGLLTYNRRKTFQTLTVQWERPMQMIVSKYATATACSPYMFPILDEDEAAGHATYEHALQRVNRNLKKIGEMIGLDIQLTTYVARHSWASIARSMDVPLSVISEGLGHDSDHTTQVYLASLDTSMINKANKRIISRVMPH